MQSKTRKKTNTLEQHPPQPFSRQQAKCSPRKAYKPQLPQVPSPQVGCFKSCFWCSGLKLEICLKFVFFLWNLRSKPRLNKLFFPPYFSFWFLGDFFLISNFILTVILIYADRFSLYLYRPSESLFIEVVGRVSMLRISFMRHLVFSSLAASLRITLRRAWNWLIDACS
ncbi:hypothetical protein F4677DRAFT_373811 [Hypoxylon crocopeplum]|nr:hypothetical protein F4677DRAFT_373811 [Hypoxylon crocopeplum]